MKKQKLLALVLLAAIFSACEDSPAPRQFVGKKIVSLASPIKRAEKVDTAGALAKMEEIYVRSKTDISFGGRRRGSGTNSPLQPGLIQVLSNGWGVSGKQVTRLYRTGLLDRYLHLHPEVLLGYDFEKLFPSYFGRLFLCRDCRINTIQSKTQFLTGQSTNPAITGTGTQPDVAYDPDHQHYLIVWNEKSDNDGSLIYARLVDRDGVTTLFGFDRKLISTPRGANGCLQSDFTDTTGLSMPTDCKENLEPSVAYNGGRFFIVWTLKGKAAHPAETPFSVILGEMVDALTLNPIVDSQAGDIWAGGRIVSKVFLYSNRSDCVRDQPCAPRNNREIQSWSSHEKPQLIPFVGENSFFTVWQTNRDFISCRDADRWSSRSVYGRVIDFNFGPGRTNKDLVRIYSDRSNNANDPNHPEYATQCAAKVDVTTVNNPRVAINQRTRKVLTVFETHKNEAGPPSSISGQLFTFNGSRDVQSGLDPWNAIPVYSQDGNSFNPDVVDFDDKFLVANDLNKTSLVLQIFGTSENRLQRIGEPVTQEVRDDSVAKKARRPRLLVASDGNFVVSYEKRARVDDLPAQIEMTSLSSSLSPIGERVTLIGADSEGETYPTNVFQELASGQRDLLTVWLGQRTVRDQVENRVFSSLVSVQPTVHVNERPTAIIEVQGVGVVPEVTVAPGTTIQLSGAQSSDPENGTDLSYQWSQTAGASVLTTLDQVETSFVAPSVADNSAQTIVIQLQVTDLDQPPLISEPISVTIHITPISTTVNTRPTACINDRSIAGVEVDETGSEPPYVRTEVILEGSCSDDGDSDVVQPLTYLWTNNEPDLELQTGDRSATYRFLAPDVSSADLEGRRTVEVRLTVNDGQAENAESVAAIATVNVRFVNRIPTISLGPDREDVNEGDDVQVRAEVSDPDGQPVTVTWRQVLPPGPSVTFTQDEEVDGRLLHFTANQVASDTSVVFEATASDGTRSSTDSIEITIHNLPGPTAPLLQGPSDGSVFAPTRLFLRWDGSSGGTGSVSYTVLFGTEDPPLAEAPGCQNLTTDLHCVIGSLAPNTTYHWQVRARDSFGNATLSSSSSINTDNSLVAWWLFADGPNSSIVVDSSGGGHIGTLNNIDPMTGWVGTPGVFDWTLDFGGLNSFVLVPGSPAFSIGGGDFTVSARINPRVLDGDHRVLLANQTVNNFQLAIDNGGASAGRLNFNGGGAPFVQSDPLAWDLTRGRWYDVTLTRGSGLVTFYRDIVAAGSGRVDAAVGDTTDLNIGYRASTGNHPFEGLIDEIAIYNKSLSPAELQNNYCSIQALAAIDPLPPACE